MKKILGIAVRAAFIIAVFLLLFRPETFGFAPDRFDDITPQSIFNKLGSLDPSYAIPWFAFAVLIKLAGIGCGIVRWNILLRAQGVQLPLWYLAKCWFMGRAIGLFLPGTMGLDGYRIVESSYHTTEVIKCTTAVAVEKLIGFIALGLLVFLTLPLGLQLFNMNLTILGVLLVGIAGFIATSFLLLLNPRVVQVLMAVVPVPGAVRHKVNAIGTAVAAYGRHKAVLFAAVALGLGIHVGTCLMYVGTAMAVSSGEWGVGDVLFASPLIIVFSVLAPTISGVGVREGVFAAALGNKYGAAESVLTGHLGLWTGEVVPYILSVPLLLLASRPSKAQWEEEVATVREAQQEANEEGVTIGAAEVSVYRQRIVSTLVAGFLGGAVAGSVWGWVESVWNLATFEGFAEATALGWAPLVYAIVLAGVGLGVGAVLLFGYLLFDRFPTGKATAALAAAGAFIVVGAPITLFRYRRDVLGEHMPSLGEALGLVAAVLGGAAVIAGLLYGLGRTLRLAGARSVAAACAVVVAVVVVGWAASAFAAPSQQSDWASPAADPAQGPPIIFIVADTLRADYLRMYDPEARPETPHLAAFAGDSILFETVSAQSSWTKASFGTIFTGMYPETHTATGKASAIPPGITTMAEVLEQGGYYTKGYANNPNIMKLFGYDQGYADYVDLKKDLYFGAEASCEKLFIYEILRRVVQQIDKRRGGIIRITDFYQPAEVVTDKGLNWIGGEQRPADYPFFLFLHYMDPHDPFRDPEKPGRGYARVQLGHPDPEKYKEAFIRSYSYEIETMDEQLGRLFENLKERGLYEDSLIVFTSDHGEEFYEHGGWWHGLSLYEEQIAVPLLMKLPGNTAAGTTNPHLTRHVDLAPTITSLVGLEPNEDWQGRPLIDSSGEAANADESQSYAHLDFEGIVLRALRGERHKLIHANEGNRRGYEPVELYDLEADPTEQENLAGEDGTADVESQFEETLEQMRLFVQEKQAEPVLSQEGMDEMKEELESLGYIN